MEIKVVSILTINDQIEMHKDYCPHNYHWPSVQNYYHDWQCIIGIIRNPTAQNSMQHKTFYKLRLYKTKLQFYRYVTTSSSCIY